MRDVLDGDPRFVLVEHDERLGFYRNFERALALVPPEVRYVALSDQDDRWFPHKLDRLVQRLEADGSLQLVAGDACLIDAEGAMVAPTFYGERMPTHDDPYSLFLVNSLIGASMMFRRELLDTALPFPRAFANVFHDHWLARVALARGAVGFEPEPLYQYVQHDLNVLGSRPADRFPMRVLLTPYLRHLVGVAPSLPADWFEHFMDKVIEPKLAVELLRARCPEAERLTWMDRMAADASYREIAHILVEYVQEARADRLRRQNVELLLVLGPGLGHGAPARGALTMVSSRIESAPKRPGILAFYLPQFHPIPENDEWWGQGFTEWRNVIRGRPLYPDHYQPHVPGELGFYDLRMPEIREAQAALAEAHGITGFCYYHYWFSGRRILERPFNEVLASGSPDVPVHALLGQRAVDPQLGRWHPGDPHRPATLDRGRSQPHPLAHHGVPRRALHPHRRPAGLLHLQPAGAGRAPADDRGLAGRVRQGRCRGSLPRPVRHLPEQR